MGAARRILPQTLAKSGNEIFLIEGGFDASARRAWYFVSVASPKIRMFLADASKGRLNILQFGEIITSGFGESPPEHIVEYMSSAHGYAGKRS